MSLKKIASFTFTLCGALISFICGALILSAMIEYPEQFATATAPTLALVLALGCLITGFGLVLVTWGVLESNL